MGYRSDSGKRGTRIHGSCFVFQKGLEEDDTSSVNGWFMYGFSRFLSFLLYLPSVIKEKVQASCANTTPPALPSAT